MKVSDKNNIIAMFEELKLIRQLAYNEKIRSIKSGSKVMIDFDSLLAFLQSKESYLPMEQIKLV